MADDVKGEEDMFWNIVILAGMILFVIYYIINHKKIREKIDGVETIDGIKYLVNNTDVQYIMYKLGSTIISKNIMETSFEKKDIKLWSPDAKPPGLVLNQAYHRFFKEIFDVKVVS